MPEPTCPRCGGTRLRRDTHQRIPSNNARYAYATGNWYACRNIDCTCCFDGVTDDPDGVLPWWVEKRPAGWVPELTDKGDQ